VRWAPPRSPCAAEPTGTAPLTPINESRVGLATPVARSAFTEARRMARATRPDRSPHAGEGGDEGVDLGMLEGFQAGLFVMLGRGQGVKIHHAWTGNAHAP